MEKYRFEAVDISAEIQSGQSNILAVEVRWYGLESVPPGEVHQAAGLWAMLGDATTPDKITTDATWRAWKSSGHVLRDIASTSRQYVDVDPMEDVDLRQVPLHWTRNDFDDSHWPFAVEVTPAMKRYRVGRLYVLGHELVPREIPPLEERPVFPSRLLHVDELIPHEAPSVRRIIDGQQIRREYPASPFWGENPTSLEWTTAGTHALTVDMGVLVTAFPQLVIHAPAGTMVELRYSEALWRDGAKGRRDDPAGCVQGYCDLFTCSEGENIIEPFVWRAFRFLKLSIHHPDGGVSLKEMHVRETHYPFSRVATFASSEGFHETLADVSWRTALCCAHEHYEDCPYYEQLQYVGDTRLQALVSYIVTGDFRLARQALRQFADSVRSDGIISSRAPCRQDKAQIIPNFSLIWIEFLEDFWRHSGDEGIIRELWAVVERVLEWFDRFDQDGLLQNVPYWIFTDWTFSMEGLHIAGSEGELNLRRFGATAAAGRLAQAIGRHDAARRLEARAEQIGAAIRSRLWNPQRELFADTLDGVVLGEHASILAILYDLVDHDTAVSILERLEKANDLARTTIYYSYYTFRAYEKLGQWGRAYQARKYLWENQLALGATTWFESPEPSRSDCHAWGSWILCDLFTSVLGIQPAQPGYRSVLVKPNFAGLAWARGAMPTVRGPVEVAWQRGEGHYLCTIHLPPEVEGLFLAPNGERIRLVPGKQIVQACDAG